MNKSGLSKLRLIAGALLLVMVLSPGHYSSAIASPDVNPDGAPERQTNPDDSPTNQIIIKYRATANAIDPNGQIKTDKINALATAAGETLTYKRAMSGDAHVLSLPARMPSSAVEGIARKLAALPDVEYAEPDYVKRPTLVPNDPSYGAQWHYFGPQGINAPAAWDITTGSATVRVAVIDTGITDHPDLAGRWVGGYDFIADVPTANDGNGRDNDPHDPGDWVTANMCGPGEPAENSSWHGTHVAGTIGAASNNGLGVAGINWVSPIVPIRVLGRCGGFTSDIADGMRWAAGLAVAGVPANANPVKVMNLSLGGPGACGSTFQNAINAVNAAGAIVVVAAGNSNVNAVNHSPANCNGVVTVAATDRDGNRTFYSNFGAVVEISAPGGETNTSSPSPAPQNGVLSTLNSGLTTPGAASYVYYQGTSMAAPHIAGVLSLMVSLDPTLNFTQSLQLLQISARPFPAGSSCNTSTCGSGIVDAAAALNAVLNPPPTSTAGPSPTPTRTNTPGGKTTPTRTPTRTNTPTATATRTSTSTSAVTPTNTATATPTATFTEVGPSPTPTSTRTATATSTVTHTPTSSATPGASDLIFADGFESGNLTAWSSSVVDGDDLSANPSAAIFGSQGLQAVLDDNNALVVIDESPALETRYRARFYFDPNSIPMAVGDAHLIFLGSSGGGTVQHLQLELRFQPTGYEVRALLLNDAKIMVPTSWLALSDAPHALELDWRASTAAGANNGGLTLWIDGVQQADLTGVDNDTRRVDQARLGVVSGVDNGTRGSYFFDAFESRRSTYIGP
jgi:serine protease